MSTQSGQKKGRKVGRFNRNPSNVKYKSSERWNKNKLTRIINDYYRRVLLYCRRNAIGKRWKDIEIRKMIKADIRKDVSFAFKDNNHHGKFTNEDIKSWSAPLMKI